MLPDDYVVQYYRPIPGSFLYMSPILHGTEPTLSPELSMAATKR